jgi:hypothetical protein
MTMDAITISKELLGLLQNAEAPVPKYNRGHVFKSIQEYAREAISPEESLSMMYCFHLYQRILTSAQYGRLKLAKGFAQEALEFEVKYSSPGATAGMESLKLPAVAYFNYVAEDYDLALERIVASYEPIQKLYELGLKEAILMKVEQVTNEFRVLYAMKREKEAMDLAGKLVGFVLNGLPNDIFPYALHEVMPDDGEKDQLSKYVVDCLLFKWVGMHPEDNSLVVQNLSQVLAAYPDSAYFRIAENLSSLEEFGGKTWDSSWDLRLFFQESVPSMVKILAIHFCFAYLQVAGELNAILLEAFEGYNEKVLRLPKQVVKQLIDFHVLVPQ